MSIRIYNELLLEVGREVCEKLSSSGFGELDSMLKALNREVVKEVKKEVKKEE